MVKGHSVDPSYIKVERYDTGRRARRSRSHDPVRAGVGSGQRPDDTRPECFLTNLWMRVVKGLDSGSDGSESGADAGGPSGSRSKKTCIASMLDGLDSDSDVQGPRRSRSHSPRRSGRRPPYSDR